MTWIWMNFRQIIEESHSFSSKKTASKSERYISVSKAFKIAYFCPYNPYFSVHFCHKILRGGGSRILPTKGITREYVVNYELIGTFKRVVKTQWQRGAPLRLYFVACKINALTTPSEMQLWSDPQRTSDIRHEG